MFSRWFFDLQYGQRSLNDVPIALLIGSIAVADQVVVNCLHIVCHIDCKYGHEKLFPDRSISRISVSIGVFPTKRTKNNCSITYVGINKKKMLGWLNIFYLILIKTYLR